MRGSSWYIVLLIVAIGATFVPALRCGFTSWDDPDTISANPRLAPRASNLMHIWSKPAGGLYIPVTYTYWSVLWPLAREEDGSLRPAVYHAGSVILHVLSALLVFSIIRQLGMQDAAGAVGALIFALHPVQVESVAWASGAKDVLSGLLALLCVDQMLRFAHRPRARHYTCALAAFALAIFAKPSAVVAPVIASVLVWWGGSVRLGVIIRWIVPMLLLGAACIVWSRLVQAEHPPTQTPLWARPLIALDALAFYFVTLFWPVDLRIIYGRTPRWVLDHGALAWAWLIPTAAGAVAWFLRRRVPLVAAGLLVFVIGLLPTLGFFRFEFQVHSTVADHYLYLPMLGVAIAAGGVVAAGPRKLMLSGAAIILLGLSILSMRQIQFWRDSQTLFGRVLRYHPENLVARDGLAKAYATQGRLADAIEQFRLIVAAAPESRLAHANLAQALMIAGEFPEAVVAAQRALQLAPPGENTSREHYLLGTCFMSVGDLDAAVFHFEQRLIQNPDQSARDDLEEARRRREATSR